MYRAVAWKAAHDGLPLDDDAQVSALARRAAYEQVDGRITIDGHDVTRAIRTPEIDKAAASVARLPHVREVLVGQQRDLGAGGAVVMEGRDIGTVVFPAADLKFYIDASPEERARRRAADPAHTGSPSNIANVQSDMVARDKSDSTRSVAPLAQGRGRDLHRHDVDADRCRRRSRDDALITAKLKARNADESRGIPQGRLSVVDWIADYRAGVESRPVMAQVAPGEIKAHAAAHRRRQRLNRSTPSSATSIASSCRASRTGSTRGSSATSRRMRCCRACLAITSAPVSASSASRGSRAPRSPRSKRS